MKFVFFTLTFPRWPTNFSFSRFSASKSRSPTFSHWDPMYGPEWAWMACRPGSKPYTTPLILTGLLIEACSSKSLPLTSPTLPWMLTRARIGPSTDFPAQHPTAITIMKWRENNSKIQSYYKAKNMLCYSNITEKECKEFHFIKPEPLGKWYLAGIKWTTISIYSVPLIYSINKKSYSALTEFVKEFLF